MLKNNRVINKRYFTLLFLLILIFNLAFSANLCKPKFKEEIKIQFVDNNFIAAANVEAKLYYQQSTTIGRYINGSFQPIYVETTTRKTGSDGKLTFFVSNNEENEEKLDCIITVYYSLLGKNWSTKIDLKNISDVTLIKVDSYTVPIKVFEEDKETNASIVFSSGHEFNISDAGLYLTLPAGNIDGYAILRDKGIKKYFNTTIDNGSSIVISFRKVNMPARVFDDYENPLPFNITIDGKSYSSNGEMLIIPIFSGTYEAFLYTAGNEIKLNVDTEKGLNYYIDIHAPRLAGLFIEKSLEDGSLSAKFFVSDEGRFASGIAGVKAYLNGLEMPVSLKKNEYFVKLIGLKDKNSFILELYDKAGNKRVVNADITYEQGRTEIKEEIVQQIDIVKTLLIIIGIAILAIIAYFIKVMYLDTR